MVLLDDLVWCAGCGVELTWSPVMVSKDRYCCQECAEGLKCNCGVRMEIDEDFGSTLSLPRDAAPRYSD